MRPKSVILSVAARSIETAESIPVESVVMVCASSSTRSSFTIILTLPRRDGFHIIRSIGVGINERWIHSSSLRVRSNGGGVKVYAVGWCRQIWKHWSEERPNTMVLFVAVRSINRDSRKNQSPSNGHRMLSSTIPQVSSIPWLVDCSASTPREL